MPLPQNGKWKCSGNCTRNMHRPPWCARALTQRSASSGSAVARVRFEMRAACTRGLACGRGACGPAMGSRLSGSPLTTGSPEQRVLELEAERLLHALGVLVLEHGHLVPARLEVGAHDLDDAPVVLRGLHEARQPHARRRGEGGVGRLEAEPLVLLAHLLHLARVRVKGRLSARVRARARARVRGRMR